MDPSIDENIRVFIRRRPILASDDTSATLGRAESGGPQSQVKQLQQDGTCSYYAATSKSTHAFKFDGCFDSSNSQSDIYERTAKPIVDSALLGYSGTIFAYGPTNSGKTFTMRGSHGSENKGVMPRCIEQLLNATRTSGGELWVSYLQIYCEIVSDLLNPSGIVRSGGDTGADVTGGDIMQLSIREKGGRVFVEGISRAPITNMQDLNNILARGDSNRSTAETNMNATSSRSHAALMVSIMIPEEKGSAPGPQSYRESLLVLVDLAGSERATASVGRQHMRLEEAKAINLSLSALGNCMSALAECRKHVPYRDSKLTRLLQGSLGGGARTAVIVAIPPGNDETGEMLNALRFANRASRVKVVAKVSRFIDYEAQYNDALKRLDDIEQQKAAWQLKRGGVDDLIAKQEEELEALREENLTLKKTLQRWEAVLGSTGSTNFSATVSLDTKNGSLATAGSQSLETTSSDTHTDTDPRHQMQVMSARHSEDIAEIKEKYERKILLFKNQLVDSQQEVANLSSELATERERHLATVQDLRKWHGKVETVEQTLGDRIEELISELDEKDGKLEDLIDMVKSQSARVDDLENRLLEARKDQEGMVAKSKVTEMESLFMETVNRLSNRVIQLEQAKSPRDGDERSGLAALPPAPNAQRIQPGGRILSGHQHTNAKAGGNKFAR